MKKYDVVIIGSGMGGLVCAGILAMEGYRVCVLEKNNQIGGSLQTFSRDKTIFDSGVHYLGGLDKGQNLYQIFKYLGLMDKLKLRRMDMDAFDKILIGNDPKEYRQAQGYDNFVRQLVMDFPEEENAIQKYCGLLQEVCNKFPLYNLRANGLYNEKVEVLTQDAETVIRSLTPNEKLQAVLAGNNGLYVGVGDETPFYIHALIVNSYILSSWKCVDGGSQIAKQLGRLIREKGGEILKHKEVVKLHTEADRIHTAETSDGDMICGNVFISNIHPGKTMDIIDSPLIKNVFRKRIKSLPHTVSSFLLDIVLKENGFPYIGYNYYYHKEGHVWQLDKYTPENWPLFYAIFVPPTSKNEEYGSGLSLLTYMHYEEVEPWKESFNTALHKNERGEDYEAFKLRKAETLLDLVSERFPQLRSCIKSYTCSTPLSYRDYIGNYDGSLYGIAKDYKDPLRTFVSPKTKIKNLYLTGQNVNIHGVLGTSISALLTCVAFLGNEDLIEKIKNA